MAIRRVLGSGGGLTFSSGGTTVNVIPKEDGAGGLKDSALTDNGTNVSTTEPVIADSGSAATKAATAIRIGTADGVNTGLFRNGAFDWMLALNGAGYFRFFSSGGLVVNSAAGGTIGIANGDVSTVSPDVTLRRRGAGNWALGLADVNGVPVAQILSVQNAITGTDLPGSSFTIDAPLGTGAGAGASTKINRAQILATGATAQTGANAFVVCETKILSNTSATTTTIATVGLASNAGGGISVFHSLTATDATNFDSETQSYNVSFVNKAGTITVGSLATTASTAANNSGSATIGATVTGATPTISLKVTPVFTTIVPTTVALYTTIINHGAGAVTCQ